MSLGSQLSRATNYLLARLPAKRPPILDYVISVRPLQLIFKWCAMGQGNVWVIDDCIERTPEWVELITWLILMDILGQSARRIGKKRAPTLILTLCAGHWRSIGRSSRPNQINIKRDFCINSLWGLCVYYRLTDWKTYRGLVLSEWVTWIGM